MRIVGGLFKGRRLAAPRGQTTRPTAERARESLFNLLGHADWAPAFTDARVLDLFAGSGALGLEALSRGAVFCRFVEQAENARRIIAANAASLGLEAAIAIDRRSALRLTARAAGDAPYHFAFLDPPYGKGLARAALLGLLAGAWLAPEAAIAVEIGADEDWPILDGLVERDRRVWGAAKMLFLQPITGDL